MTVDDAKVIALGAAVAVVGVLLWRAAAKAGEVASAVADGVAEVVSTDLNPASSSNLVNRGVEAVGQAVTGDPSWSVGGWVWDVFHDDDFAEQLKVPAPANTGGASGSW